MNDLHAVKGVLEANVAGKVLRVRDDQLSDSLAPLFAHFFPARTLTLYDVSIGEPGRYLAVQGRMALFGHDQLRASSRFYFDDDHALQVELVVSEFPPHWTFADSFPALGPALINEIPFRNPTFALSSEHDERRLDAFQESFGFAPSGLPADTPLQTGISFRASVAFSHDWGFLPALLGDTDMTVAGPVEIKDDVPRMWLMGRPEGASTLGSFRLPLDVHILSFFHAVEGPDASTALVPVSAVRLEGDLGTAGGAGVSVPVSVLWPVKSPTVVAVVADVDALSARGLGAALAVLQLDDLASFVPDHVPALDAGGVRAFRLDLALPSGRPLSAQVAVGLSEPWDIVPGVLVLENLLFVFSLSNPTKPGAENVSIDVSGELVIGGVRLSAMASLEQRLFRAMLAEDERISVAGLLNHFGVPAPSEALTIGYLALSFDHKQRNYSLEAEIENDWPLDLGFTSVGLTTLRLFLAYETPHLGVDLVGNVTIAFGTAEDAPEKQFVLTATKPSGPGAGWSFSGALAPDDTISVPALVQGVIGDGVDLSNFGLDTLDLSGLAFSVDTGTTPKRYRFLGTVDWDTGVSFTGDAPLVVQATVDIRKEGNAPPAGTIGGLIATSVPYFEHLHLGASYTFDRASRQLSFHLVFGPLTLHATYSAGTTGDTVLAFDTAGSTLTFGQLLTALVTLIEPDTHEFVLEPPWDLLNDIALDGFSVELNTTKKVFSVTYTRAFGPAFLTITSLTLTYRTTPRRSVFLNVAWTLPGDSSPRTSAWDALNETPPEVPGKGATVFDVHYFGIGQRVTFDGLDRLPNITSVMDTLQGKARPLPRSLRNQNPVTALASTGGDALRFSAESGLFLGARMSLLRTVDLSLIFNDPVVYGLRISLYGPTARVLAGLEFEILYRRISDTLGVYHVELTVPDAMRYLFFGSVAVTLPVIVVDVYTNGDFKLDLGFPWNNDFSRSFAIEILPFTGAGGFYFNKLGAATATSLEQPTNGLFDPIFEFGLGLRVGVGKSFQKGPLHAEISITVQGILEGVLTWFYPASGGDKVDYYYLRGSVSIVGRVYGTVDFAVIKVDVEVIARATVRFVIEAFNENEAWGLVRRIELTLEAEVSVKASVTVLFVKVSFSFSLTLTERFTIGTPDAVPWTLASGKTSPYLGVGGTGTRSLPAPQRLAVAALSPVTTPPASTATRGTEPVAGVPSPLPAPSLETPSSKTPASGTTESTVEHPSPSEASPMEARPSTAEVADGAATDASPAATVGGGALSLGAVTVRRTEAPSVLTWQAVQLWTEKPTLDVYFQPAFSRHAGGRYGVALLFIENAIPDDAPHSDFDTLAMSLLAWALYAYYQRPDEQAAGGTGAAAAEPLAGIEVTPSDLQRLFDAFTEGAHDAAHPFDYEHIAAFLKANFTLQITDAVTRTGGTETSSTVFPMLPSLSMAVGRTEVDASTPRFDAETLAPDDLVRFRTFFETLRVRTGAAAPPSPPADPAPLPAARYIFVEYFTLLIRTLVQQALDCLEHLEREALNLPELLAALAVHGTYRRLAGLASRYLLHGLRLPRKDPASGTLTTEPLYTFTGQQFPLSGAAGPGFAITLGKPARPDDTTPDPPGDFRWIVFRDVRTGGEVETSDTLVYTFSAQVSDLLDALDAADPASLPTTAPERLPVYADEPYRFTFRDTTPWSGAVLAPDRPPQNAGLVPFPPNLRAFQAVNGEVTLTLLYGEVTGRGTLESRPHTDVAWATRVSFSIRRVQTSDGSGLLSDTFALIGTDEDGRRLLQALWEYMRTEADPPAVVLLHETGRGRLASSDASLLLQTNLSMQRAAPGPPAPHAANLTAPADFVRLLWEASTITDGGYFLHIKGLPDQAFRDGFEATLVLLALTDPPPGSDRPVRAFHNCLVLAETVDLHAGVLYAESPVTQPVLSLPPGHLGFRLTRENGSRALDQALAVATASDRAETATADIPTAVLMNLYQMLCFAVQDAGGFAAASEALPLGPLADDPTTDADDDKWRYERVLPVFRLAASAVPAARLLEGVPDPYAGIGATSQIAVAFGWQDIYGNRLADLPSFADCTPVQLDAGPPLFAACYPVRYVDPLIGVNAWPAVAESFWFEPGDTPDTVQFHIQLAFDAGHFETDTPLRCGDSKDSDHPVCAALDTYRQIYYQLHQPGVTFTVETTVLRQGSRTLSGEQSDTILRFVGAIYAYLVDLAAGNAPSPPAGHLSVDLDLRKEGQLDYPALIFPVSASLVVERPADAVDAGAVPGARRCEAGLSPHTQGVAGTPGLPPEDTESRTTGNLRRFAETFEAALPGLRLAVGHEQNVATGGGSTTTGQLWAIHRGPEGIDLRIEPDQARYFALAPLATTLRSGAVMVPAFDPAQAGGLGAEEILHVESVDLNGLARDVLVAVEDFLDPATVVPAYAADPATVDAIIELKQVLADAVTGQVHPVLATDEDAPSVAAREAVRRRLLVNLVAGYDLETIVEFDAAVALNGGFPDPFPPRVSGQPVLRTITFSGGDNDSAALDFTLSPATIVLENGMAPMTFLFDTRTPEKYEGVRLKLVYRINAIEHRIENLGGIADDPTSSWLSFVRPSAEDNLPMGEIPIPIPLRAYPMPPSLVFQSPEPDPAAGRTLSDVRKWQYRFTYEHLDVAQDTIECDVYYNLLPANVRLNGGGETSGTDDLFAALVRFSRLHPQLVPILDGLRKGTESREPHTEAALRALKTLLDAVATAWKTRMHTNRTPENVQSQYRIDEVRGGPKDLTTVTIVRNLDAPDPTIPRIELPGFMLSDKTVDGDRVTYRFAPLTPDLAALEPVYGESSIPDRSLILPDRDVLAHQNAWAAVRLVRNRVLIEGQVTNPRFLFETPRVRHHSPVTPLLVNNRMWDVAALPPVEGEAAESTLLAKLVRRLFAAVLPDQATAAYDVHVACRYASALVEGDGLDADAHLLVSLPVLLVPRTTILGARPMLQSTAGLRANLVAGLEHWLARNDPDDPKARGGRFIFSITLFSNLDPDTSNDDSTLPLLKIEHLEVRLERIL